MMAEEILQHSFSVIFCLAILVLQAWASTDSNDVMALENLYASLNMPLQLKGWRTGGGDPCQESMTGVSCSRSSVKDLKLQGLNLSGYLGTQLHILYSLKILDLSNNYLQGEIPYGLPPNATRINLSSNKLNQNIPYSLPTLKFLQYLNLSHNSLYGSIGNVFDGQKNLKEMFLQNNQFTGSVIYLADLPLTDLNIQSNHFSGVIPAHFQSIKNLWIGGNKFMGGNYPPWNFPETKNVVAKNFSELPTTESVDVEDSLIPKSFGDTKNRGLQSGGIAGIVVAAILGVICAAIGAVIWVKKPHVFQVIRTRGCSLLSFEGNEGPIILPVKAPSSLNLNNTTGSPRRCFSKKYIDLQQVRKFTQ